MRSWRVLLLLLALGCAWAQQAIDLDQPTAEAVQAAQVALAEGQPAQALQCLAGVSAEQAILPLLRGRAYQDLDQFGQAEAAYRQALEWDPELEAAGLALSQLLVQSDRSAEALPWCGRFIDPGSCSALALRWYAVAARQADDHLLAWRLAERGMLRFPENDALRRLLLAVLVDLQQTRQARVLAAGLLAEQVDDPELWRYQAILAQQDHGLSRQRQRATVEAALLADPEDRDLRRSLVLLQLDADLAKAALATARPLQNDASATDRRLLIQAAVQAEATDQARAWLAQVPETERQGALQRLAVQLALQQEDLPAVRAGLGQLLASDESSLLLIHAALLEQRQGSQARAESLLRQVLLRGGRPAEQARLHLAQLLQQQQRHDEAIEQLDHYLETHPDDSTASRMRQWSLQSAEASAGLR